MLLVHAASMATCTSLALAHARVAGSSGGDEAETGVEAEGGAAPRRAHAARPAARAAACMLDAGFCSFAPSWVSRRIPRSVK
eukprot:COSAG02_NODE_6804_length_3351_cov_7.268696_3_plen_82_part_00